MADNTRLHVQFRLPSEEMNKLRVRASRKGMTPNDYAKSIIRADLNRDGGSVLIDNTHFKHSVKSTYLNMYGHIFQLMLLKPDLSEEEATQMVKEFIIEKANQQTRKILLSHGLED